MFSMYEAALLKSFYEYTLVPIWVCDETLELKQSFYNGNELDKKHRFNSIKSNISFENLEILKIFYNEKELYFLYSHKMGKINSYVVCGPYAFSKISDFSHFVNLTLMLSGISNINSTAINLIKPEYIGKKSNHADFATLRDLVKDAKLVQNQTKEQVSEYTPLSTNYSNATNKIINYIHNNYKEHIDLAALSRHTGMNPKYISGLFKKETEENLSEYINKVKIDSAKKMLISPDKSIREISTELSYNSESYFVSIFRKITGTTPKQYRTSKM